MNRVLIFIGAMVSVMCLTFMLTRMYDLGEFYARL